MGAPAQDSGPVRILLCSTLVACWRQKVQAHERSFVSNHVKDELNLQTTNTPKKCAALVKAYKSWRADPRKILW